MPKADAPVPNPPAFLDPLNDINKCYVYAVPRFFPVDHTNTRWLMSILRSGNTDKMKRKMELQPSMFRSTYFQLLDDPQLYKCSNQEARPIYHKQCILYLTAIGVAMLFRSISILKLLLEYRDPSEEQLLSIDEPQYATHVIDTANGDFHAYPLSIMILRGGFYDCVPDMLTAGWKPLDPICMPMRRRYERRGFYYGDWLCYTLCLTHEKPLMPIAKLVYNMTREPALYTPHRMPIAALKASVDNPIAGIMHVDDLPADVTMIGTKSLFDVVIDYDRYLQIKERVVLVKDCLNQMVTDGVNPQIKIAHALNYDDCDVKENMMAKLYSVAVSGDGEGDQNENNNAAATNEKSHKSSIARKSIAKPSTEARVPYISEPTRILQHAFHMYMAGGKTPLSQICDAVYVYIRRNVYIILSPKMRKSDRRVSMATLHQRYEFQKRDARNAITMLLNIMQLQLNKIDKLNKVLRMNSKPRFKHLSVTTQVFNKRKLLMVQVKRIRSLLLEVLLHSGEFLAFVEADYPPFKYFQLAPGAGNIDFPLNPELEQHWDKIQLELASDFSADSAEATRYMGMEDLQQATKIKELCVNLCVGEAPKSSPADAACRSRITRKSSIRSTVRQSVNASNVVVDNALDGESRIPGQQLLPVGSAGESRIPAQQSEEAAVQRMLSGEAANYLRNAADETPTPGGRVTFVKVKRRLKFKLPPVETAATHSDEAAKDAEAGSEEHARPATLAFKLADQIADLGRCAQADGVDVTPKLVEIYRLILGELSQIADLKSPEAGLVEAQLAEDLELAGDAELAEEAELDVSTGSVLKDAPGEELEHCDDRMTRGAGDEAGNKGSVSSRRQIFKPKSSRGSKGWKQSRRDGRIACRRRQKAQRVNRVVEVPPGGTEFEPDADIIT